MKHGDGSLMVWGCFAASVPGWLAEIQKPKGALYTSPTFVGPIGLYLFVPGLKSAEQTVTEDAHLKHCP